MIILLGETHVAISHLTAMKEHLVSLRRYIDVIAIEAPCGFTHENFSQ